MNSHRAENLTGKPTTIKQRTPRYVPLIKVNQVKIHESKKATGMQHKVKKPQTVVSNTVSHNLHQNLTLTHN